MERLKYVSNAVIESLRNGILGNFDRYMSGNFAEAMLEGEWSIQLKTEFDAERLAEMDPSGGPAVEIANSRLVWEALPNLSPALAVEEGIWVRLTHVECLDYTRARWLDAAMNPSDCEGAVAKHFFADTLTKRRDDNAISRLWWNAHIANLIMPDTDLAALDILLQKADVRLNVIERSQTSSRPALAAGIVRALQNIPWLLEDTDHYRGFMRTLNKLGGGVLFEALSHDAIDEFMRQCAGRSGMP